MTTTASAGAHCPPLRWALLLVCATACADPPQQAGPPVPVVDHHVHIRSPAGAEQLDLVNSVVDEPQGEPSAALTAADALAALDSAGVERGVVLSIAYMYGMPEVTVEDERAKVRAENDYVATEVALHPDRLFAFCSVNPIRDYALEEIDRCADDPRVRGLKLHLANSDVDLRDAAHVERLVQVFALLGRRDLPAVVHMRTRAEDYGAEDAGTFIDRVLAVASGLPLQIAHVAGWGGYDEATDAALSAFAQAFADGRLDRERVTFDIGAVVFQPEAAGPDTALARQVREANARLADRIREIGVDRFLYATDWPGWPPVPDPVLAIQANVMLVRSALPLDEHELTTLFTNVGGVVGPR